MLSVPKKNQQLPQLHPLFYESHPKETRKNHYKYMYLYTGTWNFTNNIIRPSHFSVDDTEKQSLGSSPQFRMPYLKVSLVFFIFQTRVFHNKLIQNPKGAKNKTKWKYLRKWCNLISHSKQVTLWPQFLFCMFNDYIYCILWLSWNT